MTSSTTPVSSRIAFFALLAGAVFGASSTGCAIFGSDDSSAPPTQDTAMPSRDDNDGGAKAPAVGGPADSSELTDALGVFVSPSGDDRANGNHDHPLASIQTAIDLAKRIGKRVYVCSGTFHEALTLADSISVIGGLTCVDNDWRVGAEHTRIEASTSPAVRAQNITTPTRLESLDIVAPDATAPSGSSIGLLADHTTGLTIASSKITAGNAANGANGKDGIQLSNAATVDGAAGWDQISCTTSGGCNHDIRGFWANPPRGKQGANVCVGAPGFVAESGGFGGSGGLYQIDLNGPITTVDLYQGSALYKAEPGDHAHTSGPGVNGADGTSAPINLTITAQGFSPIDGTPGKDGAPGAGGSGGDGFASTTNDQHVGDVWTGWTGAGGGAGGCPGLAGSAGTGGGASISAILVESPVAFDAVELHSARGGAGGLGSFGSSPTAGGAAGTNSQSSLIPSRTAQPGGHGGAAGISGNGANGPSLGIAYVGAKPVIDAQTKITPGAPAPAIDARSRTTVGIVKTIPATPAGISKDILAL